MELYLPPTPLTRNPVNGRLLPGYVPKNKGKKWREYNVPRKSRKKILKNLTDEGRQKGRASRWEKYKRRVIGIKDGEWYGCFENTCDASRKTGIEQANIAACCRKKRPRAGGIEWYREDDEEWMEKINGFL